MLVDWFKKNCFYCIALVCSLAAMVLLSIPIEYINVYIIMKNINIELMGLSTYVFMYIGFIGLVILCLFSILYLTPLKKWKTNEVRMSKQCIVFLFFILSFSLFAVNFGTTNQGIITTDKVFDIAGALYFLSTVFLLLENPKKTLQLLKKHAKEVVGITFTCLGLILLTFPGVKLNFILKNAIDGTTILEQYNYLSFTYFDLFRIDFTAAFTFNFYIPLILIILALLGKGILCLNDSSNMGYFSGITDIFIFSGAILISRLVVNAYNPNMTIPNVDMLNSLLYVFTSKDWGIVCALIIIFISNFISIACNLYPMAENSQFLEKNERIFILITWALILYFVFAGCIIWL